MCAICKVLVVISELRGVITAQYAEVATPVLHTQKEGCVQFKNVHIFVLVLFVCVLLCLFVLFLCIGRLLCCHSARSQPIVSL